MVLHWRRTPRANAEARVLEKNHLHVLNVNICDCQFRAGCRPNPIIRSRSQCNPLPMQCRTPPKVAGPVHGKTFDPTPSMPTPALCRNLHKPCTCGSEAAFTMVVFQPRTRGCDDGVFVLPLRMLLYKTILRHKTFFCLQDM